MSNEELQKRIDTLAKDIKVIERGTIKVQLDPVASLYLKKFVDIEVEALLLTKPTQTYSTASPSGDAPQGSLWMKDTGALATNEIHVYSGTAWVRMK